MILPSLFQIPGVEVFIQTDGESGWPLITFRKEKYLAFIKYSPVSNIDDSYLASIAEKIKTLVYNQVQFEQGKWYYEQAELNEFIDRNYIKYRWNEKLELVLEYVASCASFDGQVFQLQLGHMIQSQLWRKWYLNNINEFEFYVECLYEQGLITHKGKTAASYQDVKLTLEGLARIEKITEQSNSRYCFVAMSFDKELAHVYSDGIQPALSETGFIPFIVSESHVESDKTINDEIIAGIKKSRFTIADFTQHKHGVYFEAGYALGRNQKVIYTCREDELGKAHFDTRNFQHIVWSTPEDLKKKLVDKINAFILE
jgi:hypothetical protein